MKHNAGWESRNVSCGTALPALMWKLWSSTSLHGGGAICILYTGALWPQLSIHGEAVLANAASGLNLIRGKVKALGLRSPHTTPLPRVTETPPSCSVAV